MSESQSDELLVSIIVGSVLVGLFLYIGYDWMRSRRRTSELENLAPSLGLTFFGLNDYDQRLSQAITELNLLSRARFNPLSCFFSNFKSETYSGTVSNVLAGDREGARLFLFDFSYTLGGAKGLLREQTVVIIISDRLNLPDFQLHPVGLMDVARSGLGWGNANFQSSSAAFKRYRLRASNPDAAESFFSDEIVHCLENMRPTIIRAAGNKYAIYQRNKLVSPSESSDILRRAERLYTLFS